MKAPIVVLIFTDIQIEREFQNNAKSKTKSSLFEHFSNNIFFGEKAEEKK